MLVNGHLKIHTFGQGRHLAGVLFEGEGTPGFAGRPLKRAWLVSSFLLVSKKN